MQFEFSEQQKNNLILFLDRVPATGRVENQAYAEIIYIMNNPIQQNIEQVTIND